MNLICDVALPDKYETTLVKPIISGHFWTDEIGTRLIKSAAKTRPSAIVHSEDRSTFILEGKLQTIVYRLRCDDKIRADVKGY